MAWFRLFSVDKVYRNNLSLAHFTLGGASIGYLIGIYIGLKDNSHKPLSITKIAEVTGYSIIGGSLGGFSAISLYYLLPIFIPAAIPVTIAATLTSENLDRALSRKNKPIAS